MECVVRSSIYLQLPTNDKYIEAIRGKVPDLNEEFLHPATVRRNINCSAQSVVWSVSFNIIWKNACMSLETEDLLHIYALSCNMHLLSLMVTFKKWWNKAVITVTFQHSVIKILGTHLIITFLCVCARCQGFVVISSGSCMLYDMGFQNSSSPTATAYTRLCKHKMSFTNTFKTWNFLVFVACYER